MATFQEREISTSDGAPASLYRLDWDKTSWFYTNADAPIARQEIVGDQMQEVVYEPRAIQDSGVTQGTSGQNDFTMDGPSDLDIVRLFRGSPPAETIWFTVRRVHDNPADAPIYWKGIVTNVKRPKPASCQVIGRPLSAFLKRTGLRLCWTKECPHFLYGPGCYVDKAAFAAAGTVAAFDAASITVALAEGRPAGWFRGGFVEWTANDDGTMERRMIEDEAESAEGVKLSIMGIVDFLDPGQALTAYPGCNRTPEDCKNKFNNKLNYGGFENMPGASPFDTPIW